MQDKQITKISQVTQEVTLFLRELGFSNYYIIKIYDLVGDAGVALTEDNPYWLLSEFPRIGFKKADEVATVLGFEMDSPLRVEAAVNYVLGAYAQEGHSYAPFGEFSLKIGEFLNLSSERIRDVIEDMAYEGKIQLTNLDGSQVVYFYGYYKAECEIAKKFAEICEPRTGFKKVGNNLEAIIKKCEAEREIELSREQRTAVLEAIGTGVSIITGGPGTGKTTIINTLIKIFEDSNLKVSVAAPTGRAAKRIMETSGHYASTVHRLLEYYYDESCKAMFFNRNHDNPLSADVIIVDETSMMDLMLMDALLDAMTPGTRLVLVGDSDQLPSVGAGNVLKDLIDSEYFSVSKLTQIYRQTEESTIVANAHRINHGEYPELVSANALEDVKTLSESVLITADKQNDILDKIVQIAKLFELDDIQILSPTKKGILGTANLNKYLQNVFNPAAEDKAELAFGERVFRLGDKVMQLKNDYQLEFKGGHGVFNGEIGAIKAIDKENKTLTILYDGERWVEYPYTKFDELEHAYAITIHKSQGSEFKTVIIPMTWFPPKLSTRSLIYTGFTRAKERAVIVGNPEYLNAMVDNNQSGQRNSGLASRIIGLYQGVN